MTLTSSVGRGKLIIYFACFSQRLWQLGWLHDTSYNAKCCKVPPTVHGAGGPLTAARRAAGICQRPPTALSMSPDFESNNRLSVLQPRAQTCMPTCPCARLAAARRCSRRLQRFDRVLLLEHVEHLLGDSIFSQLLLDLWHARTVSRRARRGERWRGARAPVSSAGVAPQACVGSGSSGSTCARPAFRMYPRH